MAIRLAAWLEDAFESQLLLGNQWLQDRHEDRKSCGRLDINRQWSVYHDNGSSLDTINYLDPERNCALQVLKLCPLTLTDGQNHIISHFTSHCARDFFQRHPTVSHLAVGTTIAIRKYTVRSTSYGPPRERLRLILNRIDWLGESCERIQNLNSDSPRPLHACKQIGVLLEQLRHIRALRDSRCLVSGAEAAEVEAEAEALDDATAIAMGPDDNMPDGNNLHSQMQDTQLPFGTQIPQPSCARGSGDDPQVIGVNRLEPVMAGNTQRTDIRPGAANTDYEKRMGLLSLIGKANKPSASKTVTPSVPGWIQSAFGKPQSTTTPTTDESPRLPSVPMHQQPIRSEAEIENGDAASSVPNHGKKRVRKVRDISPEVRKPAQNSRVKEHDIQQSLIEHGSDSPPECPWMKGFVFNSETLKVPRLQAECLGKETSWLKPQPGVPPFQHGNMPQTILKNIHLMADERAGTDIDEDSDLDPSPESLDPSPESLLQKTQEDEHATMQDDDDTTSQLSWEQTPDPPQHPTRALQGLPPDSSIEKQASHSNRDSASQQRPIGQQSSHPPVIDVSDDDEPVDPPSSPPAPAAPTDSDEEMDMEESVPQALGEDLVQRAQPPSASDKLPDSVSLPSQASVQVKETPYDKGTNASDIVRASAFKNAQNSSAESKHISSTSIVHSTYDTPSLSDLADLGIVETAKEHPSDGHEEDIGTAQKDVGVHHDKAKNPNDDDTGDIEMLDDISDAQDLDKETARDIVATPQLPDDIDGRVIPTSPSHAIRNSAPLPPKNGGLEAPSTVPHVPSQSNKRKSVASPTKSNRRQSKRREIKIVGFGDDAPSDVDLIASLPRDREESLRRYREQRNSSTTSFESRPEPSSKLPVEQASDAMEIHCVDIASKREISPSTSPRHQGLYDEHSPQNAQPTTIPASQPSRKHAPLKAYLRDIQTRGPVPISAQPLSVSSETPDQGGNMSVFQSFKIAYPEYSGDEKHFRNQCTHMYQLEQEDKMVPKWQWDDFIIRNRTDYSRYAMDCISQGEDPEPYFRFYKDNIRDTLYTRGIIEKATTLQKALEELGSVAKSGQTVQPTQTPRPVRKSLPSAFNQPKKPTHGRVNKTQSRPRHSLPTHPHLHPQSPLRSSSSASASSSRPQPRHSHPTKRVSSASRPTHQPPTDHAPSNTTNTTDTFDAQGSTGDKYRNFFFGFQRSTSWTGSTKVDPGKRWPQNLAGRPSIADAPRGKVDVLDWGDVLGKMERRGRKGE